MIYHHLSSDSQPLRKAISEAYLRDETECVHSLLSMVELSDTRLAAITARARQLISKTRELARLSGGIDALLREYDLSSREGVALMCLAEALLRIPDKTTADELIKEKLSRADWKKHLGQSHSLFVNASTWGLMLTGKLLHYGKQSMNHSLNSLLARSSDPVIRLAIREAMNIIGQQFVMGETIDEAIQRSHSAQPHEYLYSYDMLGEAALTQMDAQRYLDRYLDAIQVIAKTATDAGHEFEMPGISVKLSALHPRVEFAQRKRLMQELVPTVLSIAQQARHAGINITIDAEEADRLELTLDVFKAVYTDPSLGDWQGLGLAVQAYQKRAIAVIKWLADLSQAKHRRIMLRLVKGAYWDTEIKRAQELGLDGYPVFTRKTSTDLSYLACVHHILSTGDSFYPQFATHNAYTISSIETLAPDDLDYEFQRLHGMGEAVYHQVIESNPTTKCRVYAPVGNHADLLPYLVRRLLENGANTSFINRIENDKLPIEELIRDPIKSIQSLSCVPHPAIPLPRDIYKGERRNARGMNLSDILSLQALEEAFSKYAKYTWQAAPLIRGETRTRGLMPRTSVSDPYAVIGHVSEATPQDVADALHSADEAQTDWAGQPVEDRATIIERAADLLESNMPELMYLCIQEGGRCIRDALAEVREAIDSCRYYAAQGRRMLIPLKLPGPTGETNILGLHGRGVMACISPWNFPIAIFTGQIIAALMAGNTVIAKPAHQTPLSAMRVVELLHEAGIPGGALNLLPGQSSIIGEPLLNDERVAGVIFTGSSDVGRTINQTLARRPGPIVPLIAETGGINAMIVDSSALPEQVVSDAITSAFNSAGQRCSALRVLFLQDAIADRVIDLLTGALAELQLADPLALSTDIGPLIDAGSKAKISSHVAKLQETATLVCQAGINKSQQQANYVAPAIFEIDSLSILKEEIFGPVLHIVRYTAQDLDKIIDSINASGYGLTLGIHSRIEEKAVYIAQRAKVGNIYVNRNMIGAVVGVQPFGGEGLSGTGPKAGGPNYLRRLITERTLTVNTTAIGGNTDLLNMNE